MSGIYDWPSPMQEVLNFLNSIEGSGYGGMASFEIAKANVADALGSDLAEECAKIAESHVGAGGYPAGNDIEDSCRRIGYDDACRDIAKAIRDAMT